MAMVACVDVIMSSGAVCYRPYVHVVLLCGITSYGNALASFVRSVMPPYNHLTQGFTYGPSWGGARPLPLLLIKPGRRCNEIIYRFFSIERFGEIEVLRQPFLIVITNFNLEPRCLVVGVIRIPLVRGVVSL